jgi:hypothetical protein
MRAAIMIGVCLMGLTGQARAQTPSTSADAPAPSAAEIRELLEAAKATAKATRENVDYVRVVPDILFQILTKLDKIEDKIDKVETALKKEQPAREKSR